MLVKHCSSSILSQHSLFGLFVGVSYKNYSLRLYSEVIIQVVLKMSHDSDRVLELLLLS